MTQTIIQPYSIESKRSIDLTLSENPLGSSPVVLDKLKNCRNLPSIYPTVNGNNLKLALADFLACKPDNIFVTNGSENIIFNIPRVLAAPNDSVIIPQLTFPLFRIYSEFAGLQVKLVFMNNDLGISLSNCLGVVTQRPFPKLLFLCNPNNPTGMILTRKELLTFLDQVPESVIVVIDEANIDFGGESMLDQAWRRSNVLVLRTFSKGFGLAGFRIGFAVGNQKLIKKLNAETQPFPISSLSEQLAIAALSDPDFVEQSKQTIAKEREKIKRGLTKLGYLVFDSQANNIFVKLPQNIEPQFFFSQLAKNDVSVVSGIKFSGFDNSFFRVSPRNEIINQKFLSVIKKISRENYDII